MSKIAKSPRALLISLLYWKDQDYVGTGVEVPADVAEEWKRSLYQLYPEAEILEKENGNRASYERQSYLVLERPGVWPIKRYPQFVDPVTREAVEPLNEVWGTMLGTNSNGLRVEVRYTLHPLSDSYRKQATKAMFQLGPREFERAERTTDQFLSMSLNLTWMRVFLRPLAAFFRIRIPLPQEGPLRVTDPESSSLHERESLRNAATAKIQRHLFAVRIELKVTGAEKLQADKILHQLSSAFAPFDLPHSNRLVVSRKPACSVLSTEELATLWHLPMSALPGVSFDQQKMKVLPPPEKLPVGKSASVLGETLFRNERRLVSRD